MSMTTELRTMEAGNVTPGTVIYVHDTDTFQTVLGIEVSHGDHGALITEFGKLHIRFSDKVQVQS